MHEHRPTVQTGWVSHEIGRSTAPDEFRFENGRSTIEAGGGTMQGQDDQFRFVYQIVSGDAKITAASARSPPRPCGRTPG